MTRRVWGGFRGGWLCAYHAVLRLHAGRRGGSVRRDGKQGTGAASACGLGGALIGLFTLQTVALGQKMDLVFSIMRVHFMFGDFPGIKRDIRKARRTWRPAHTRRC